MKDALIVGSCIESREAYDRVERFVSKHDFGPMASFWWELVVDWYNVDDSATGVDRSVLRERGIRKAGPKHAEAMQDWFDDMPDPLSPANVISELLAVKRYTKGTELAALLTDDSRKIIPVAEEYIELLRAETIERSTWREATSLDLLDEVLDDEHRITILPQSLNRRCRNGALPGHHIVLFGPTEIGKSLVAINMVCGFLRQDKRVLYVSNEDGADIVLERVRSNLSGMSPEQARQNSGEAISIARSKGIDLLAAGNMDPGDVAQIEEKIEEHQANVVVIDQLRNLHTVGGSAREGVTQRMDRAAQEVRSLLIRKQVVGVSIVQAYAGEHGKHTVWYSADDVDSSRVGVPASADLLVAIGADDEMLIHNERAISLCKNKLGGKRDRFVISVTPELSKCR